LKPISIRNAETPIQCRIWNCCYYDDIRFLREQGHDIKTHRDDEKRIIVEPETVQLLSALREHVVTTGSREGFKYGGGLSVVGETSLGAVAADGPTPTPEYGEASGSGVPVATEL